jgi:hypothetical protein
MLRKGFYPNKMARLVVKKGAVKMNLKMLMIIKAVVCLVLGVLILAAPEFTYSIFGTEVKDGGVFAAREYGAALIGALFLTWYARDAAESQARRAIILDLFIYDAIGFVVTLIYQLTGLFNWLGWGIVAIYLFFAAGYGYFWFKKPA